MDKENKIISITEDLNAVKYEIDDIKSLIHTIRGKQVMIDSDIARLYKVETRAVNQAVKRNIERFPQEFCFQLNEEEYNVLKSQYVISKGGRRKIPYAFTEQGVAMLSAVLHSNIAIQVSINIINAFIEMRSFILNNKMLFEKISNIELKQIKITEKFHDRFLILDRKYTYHIGASLKDLGKKCFGITLIKYEAIMEDILSKI